MEILNSLLSTRFRRQVLAGCLLLVAATGIAVQAQRLSEESIPQLSATAPLLEGQAYIDKRDYYIARIDTDGPRAALDELRVEMSTNEALLNNCHPLVHELGRAAYERYGYNKAIAELDDVCNSGYIHGVIEQHFSSLDDISRDINSLCSEFLANTFAGWQCNHGLGHGIMYYTVNELPKSLGICEQLTSQEAVDACTNGVFMENYIVGDEFHSSDYTDDGDMLFPCHESYVDIDAKANCYLYAPTYFLSSELGTIEDALGNCRTNDEFESVCVRGVGGAVMKSNLARPLAVLQACEDGRVRVPSCYSGALSLYAFHHGGLEELSQLCTQLSGERYDVCVQTKIAYTDYF